MAEDQKVHPAVWEGEHDQSRRASMVPFLSQIKEKVWDDGMDRSDWEVKMEHFYNMRFAYLEDEVSWPWPGADETIVPVEDMLIDRVKPGMVGLVDGQNPTVSFQELLGSPRSDRERRCEYTMENLLKVRDKDFINQYSMTLDSVLTYGFGIQHPFYSYKTELQRIVIHKDRLPAPLNGFYVMPNQFNMQHAELLFRMSGGKVRPITKDVFDSKKIEIRKMVKEAWNLFDENVTDKEAIDSIMSFLRDPKQEIVAVMVRQEIENTSKSVNIDIFDFWVPPYTRSMETASRATVRLTVTEEELSRRVRDENWNPKAAQKVASPSNSTDGGKFSWMVNRNIDQIRNDREGIITRRSSDTYELFATYCWGNFLSSKEKVRGIIVWSPNSEEPLKAVPLPYNHGQWPFSQIRYEYNDERFYSPRGIPEKVSDLSNILTWQEREVQNNSRIVNSPTFMYEEMTNFDPQDIPWTPGQWIKVGKVDRVQPLVAPDRILNFERHSQIIRSMIEQYAGAPDLALSQMGDTQNSRTATEIELIDQLSQVTLGFHSKMIQWGMKPMYRQYWSNWIQWGPDRFDLRISGEEPIRLTKQDIMGDFEIIPRGTAGNVNPALESRKALQRLGVLLQVKPILDADPQARIDADIPEGVMDYFMKEDFVIAKRLLRRRSPEEQQQIIQQRKQQEAMAAGIANNTQPVPLNAYQQKLEKAKQNAPAGGNQLITGA